MCLNMLLGAVVVIDGRAFSVMGFAFDEDRITAIDALADLSVWHGWVWT